MYRADGCLRRADAAVAGRAARGQSYMCSRARTGDSVALRRIHRCHELAIDSPALYAAARKTFAVHPAHAVAAIFRRLQVASQQAVALELSVTVLEAPAPGFLQRGARFPEAGRPILIRLAAVARCTVSQVDRLGV